MTSTALLIMDVQQGIVERFAGGDDGYLERLATAIAAARAADVMVGYVTVGFRPGYPEVSDRNKSFAAIAGTGRFTDGDPGTRIHPAVAPAAGDVTVTKRRVSAFAGSDLDVVLRAGGTGHVLADGCLDADPEVHQVLLGKLFPRQAEVTTIAEWTASLRHD